jgi:hypothetical protein
MVVVVMEYLNIQKGTAIAIMLKIEPAIKYFALPHSLI